MGQLGVGDMLMTVGVVSLGSGVVVWGNDKMNKFWAYRGRGYEYRDKLQILFLS
jgi:hypothetical protein